MIPKGIIIPDACRIIDFVFSPDGKASRQWKPPFFNSQTLYITVETSDNTALFNIDFCACKDVWIYATKADIRRAERLRDRLLELIPRPSRVLLSLPYGLDVHDFCVDLHDFFQIEKRAGFPIP